MSDTLHIDVVRLSKYGDETITGVFVRAQHPETSRWMSADIAILTRKSLLRWLRSRGGDNPWAEDVVGIVLGYGHLHRSGDLEKLADCTVEGEE